MKERLPVSLTVFFVDQITLSSLMHLLIHGRSVRSIWHFEPIAPAVQRCLKLLCRVGLIRAEVRQVKYHIGQVRDDAGETVGVELWRSVRGMCSRIKQEQLIRNPLIKAMASEWAIEKILLYFEKLAENDVKRECTRIRLVEWVLRDQLHVDPSQCLLLIEDRQWFSYLEGYACSQGIRLLSYHHWGLGGIARIGSQLLWVLRKGIVALLRKIWCWIQQMLASGRLPSSPVRSPAGKQPAASTIAAHYGHRKLSFDPTERSEFFWLNGYGFPCSEILLYGYVSDKPIDPEIRDQMHSRGIKVLGRGPGIPPWFPTKRLFLILWRTGLRLLRGLSTCMFHGQFVSPYYVIRLLMLMSAYAYWYDFFSANRVRVNVGMLTTSVAQVLAMDSLDGVSVAYQHSMSNILTPSTVLSAGDNIQFVFSERFDRLWHIIEAPVDGFLNIGYIYDSSIRAIHTLDRVAKMRQEFEVHGAHFVLCFFDENSVDRWDCSYSNESAADDYEFLLKWLLADQELGIVFKPKKSTNLFHRIDRVSGLIDQAKETGRCKFLMSDTLYGSCFPAEAAKIADVCIGKLIGSTAALEASLAGVPTLLIDTEGIRIHPLYSLGFGRVVFDNWDTLKAAIEQYRSSADAYPELGDWSLMLRDFDPFQDGQATLRMRHYLHWVCEAFKKGASKETALKTAAEKFSQRWGQEHIRWRR